MILSSNFFKNLSNNDLQLNRRELQAAAQNILGYPLHGQELKAVVTILKRHIQAQLDWVATLEESLALWQELGLSGSEPHEER